MSVVACSPFELKKALLGRVFRYAVDHDKPESLITEFGKRWRAIKEGQTPGAVRSMQSFLKAVEWTPPEQDMTLHDLVMSANAGQPRAVRAANALNAVDIAQNKGGFVRFIRDVSQDGPLP